MILTLGMAAWMVSMLAAVFLLACIVMMLTVLIQRPQGGGLSGAFGSGGGAGQTAFGTKTGDALTIATIAMFIIFLLLAIALNFATRPENIGPSQPAIIPGEGAVESEAGTTSVPGEGDADLSADPAVDAALDGAAEIVEEAADTATDAVPSEDDAPADEPGEDG